MPTTPKLALRTPAGVDAINVPSDMLALATDVENMLTGVQAKTATGALTATGGRFATFVGAAGQTLTMPAAAIGFVIEVLNIDTSDPCTVSRAGSDTFTPPTNGTAVNSFTLPAGSRVRLLCVSAGTWRIIPEGPPALLPAATTTIVSAVPSPYDGMVVLYQNASMLTNGIMWRFRYNAAGGTYKWEAVGEQVPISGSATTMASGLTSIGPPQSGTAASVVVPMAGRYDIPYEAGIGNTSISAATDCVPYGAGLASDMSFGIRHFPPIASGTRTHLSRRMMARELTTTGGTLAMGCAVGSGTGTWENQRVALHPIRVS